MWQLLRFLSRATSFFMACAWAMWAYWLFSAGWYENNPEIVVFNGYVEGAIAVLFVLLGLQAIRAARDGVHRAVAWTYPLGLFSALWGFQAGYWYVTYVLEKEGKNWASTSSMDWPHVVFQGLFMLAGVAAIVINIVDFKGAYEEDPYDSLVPSS